MTLLELSVHYRFSAQLIRTRLCQLRAQLRGACEEETRWQLRRRIAVLTEMLRQMNELAALTEHYYERSYFRNEKYSL